MMKIVVAYRADSDLMEIFRKIESDNPRAAAEFLKRIDEAFFRISEFPFIGRARPKLGPALRSIAVGNHLIFYRVDSESIRIARVIDGRRDLDAEFER